MFTFSYFLLWQKDMLMLKYYQLFIYTSSYHAFSLSGEINVQAETSSIIIGITETRFRNATRTHFKSSRLLSCPHWSFTSTLGVVEQNERDNGSREAPFPGTLDAFPQHHTTVWLS